MRKMIHIAVLGALSIALSAAGQRAPAPRAQFSSSERADLTKISAYMNNIPAMKGSFIQIADNGASAQGNFYIEKPGRMRFEYLPPSPILIVSDGSTISVENKRLNTVDRYPLDGTPLELILSNDINLGHDRAVTSVETQAGFIIVHARSNNRRAQGNIAITFSAPEIELRQWTIKDSQGKTTTVVLRNAQTVQSLPKDLFALNTKPETAAKPN